MTADQVVADSHQCVHTADLKTVCLIGGRA